MNKFFSDKLDSMLSSWYVQNAFLLDSTELAEADTLKQTLPDSIYIQRLQTMQSAVSLSFNNTVKGLHYNVYCTQALNRLQLCLVWQIIRL